MKKFTFILIFLAFGVFSCQDEANVKPKTNASGKQGDTVNHINDGPGS
ncbi:hypothetical protein EMA8858_01272 [Emticicia aquatica]|uniref:Uncharacterized protein n=2 Tax=Emticicia aquatica TaxID=1681835 RepID=A0ABM9ANV3_9BACT|nr:hypothetical protein EMA8858_01272 [Emticicia aquatica]